VYHNGRLYTGKYNGSIEKRYSCCKGEPSAGGCGSNVYHVVEGYTHPDINKGYVVTKPKKQGPESCPGMYALDCEMCYTTIGMELTRVSVVNMKGKSVYETLVKPKNKVLDLNTKFSGIEEGDLDMVNVTLEDVQKHLLNMFNQDTILIGHSLDSDLRSLKLIHSTVIDTTEIFPHKRGLPFKRALRTLMAEYLQKIIQNEEGGHDSQEDATACIQLILSKVRQDLLKMKR
jgi:RNA exonuclease 1